jgi:hypothetical protein
MALADVPDTSCDGFEGLAARRPAMTRPLTGAADPSPRASQRQGTLEGAKLRQSHAKQGRTPSASQSQTSHPH